MLSNVTYSGIEELLTYFNPSWWVYTRVKVLETQGPKHPFINHIFVLKIEPKLQDWFHKLGGALPQVEIVEVWQDSDTTLTPLHFCTLWIQTLR